MRTAAISGAFCMRPAPRPYLHPGDEREPEREKEMDVSNIEKKKLTAAGPRFFSQALFFIHRVCVREAGFAECCKHYNTQRARAVRGKL
jgi:hypothetical protein